MVEDKVREDVLYREALAMGLDKDDNIVKRRMAQKMQFLAEDVAAAHEPTSAQLKDWFDKNKDKFALPSRYSFRHVYFSPDKRGTNAQADAAKALTQLVGQPADSKLAASLGDRSCSRSTTAMPPRTPSQRNSGHRLLLLSRISNPARGKGRSSRVTAGTWFM